MLDFINNVALDLLLFAKNENENTNKTKSVIRITLLLVESLLTKKAKLIS